MRSSSEKLSEKLNYNVKNRENMMQVSSFIDQINKNKLQKTSDQWLL